MYVLQYMSAVSQHVTTEWGRCLNILFGPDNEALRALFKAEPQAREH